MIILRLLWLLALFLLGLVHDERFVYFGRSLRFGQLYRIVIDNV